MKSFLLTLILCSFISGAGAQESSSALPKGRYLTAVGSNKWEKGDIIILDESRYQLSSTKETGEYRHSESAQRVFFTSGPLKNAFARMAKKENQPAILLPLTENSGNGLNLTEAITAVWTGKN